MPIVYLCANLRKLARTKEIPITEATIWAVLNELFKRNPMLEDFILANRKFRLHIVITLNGHKVIDIKKPVTVQNVIAIFPPISGG